MSLHRLALAATCVLAAAICALALMPVDRPEQRPDRAAPTPAAHRAPIERPTADVARATRTRWRLDYTFEARMGDRPPMGGRLAGWWIVEPLTDDRIAVRLEDAVVHGAADVVDADALAGGAEMRAAADGSAVVAMGFAEPTAAPVRRLYAELASQTWLAEGVGARWRAVEQDVVGTRVSAFHRQGETVSRTLVALTGRRTASGVVTKGIGTVDYDNRARFTFDDLGLAEIVVEIRLTRSSRRSIASGRLRLERIDAESVRPRAGVATLVPIERHFDPAQLRAARDRSTLGDRDLGRLLGAAADLDGLDPDDPSIHARRGEIRRALSALLRLEPAAAEVVADAVRARPDDRDRARLLLGALGSAETEAGTDALAGLVDDDTLHADIRRNAIDHISLGRRSTPPAVDALMAALDGEHDLAAAAALGSQARRMAGTDPDGAAELVDALLGRAMGAADMGARLQALRALGNSGSPLALPYLRGLTGAPNPAVSESAIFALRFIPGESADLLLDGMLNVGGDRSVAAIRAIGFRGADRWRERLAAASFDERSRAAAEVRRVLANWM